MTDDEIIAQISLELGGPYGLGHMAPPRSGALMGLGRNNPRNTAQ